MGDHLEPGAFAVGNDEQYRPVQAVGDQRVRVGGPAWLTCHASRPLDGPGRGDGPLVVVVHGALRDSDRYLTHAWHAARLAGCDPLIVAPQFLADVDTGVAAGLPDGALDTDHASPLLEVSPAAMAQGANRFDRGLRYDQHVRRLAHAAGIPARHRLIQLAGVGHAAGDVLAAPQVRELVFGPQVRA